MIIKEVTLRNIRSYTKADLEFPEGKVLLSGDIGAGKSTILLAVEFALFGLIRGSLNGASLLRTGSTSGSVILKFECQGKDYIVKRGLKKNGSNIAQTNGYLIFEGTKYELSPLELKAKILSILGYSSSLVSKYKTLFFRYTVYTPQEQMREIIYMNPEERKDILRKLFQLDKYKQVASNSDIVRKSIREKRKELQGFASDLEEKKKKKKETEKKIADIKKEKSQKEKRLEELKPYLDKLDSLEKELNNLNSKQAGLESKKEYLSKSIEENNKQKSRLSDSLDNLKKEIENINEQLEQLGKRQDKEGLNKQIKELEEEYNKMKEGKLKLEHLRESRENVEKEIEQLKESISELTTKIEKLNAHISHNKLEEDNSELLEKRLADYKEKRDNVMNKISEQKHIIHQSKEFLDSLKDKSVCPTCKQPITKEHMEELASKEEKKQGKAQQQIEGLNQVLESLDGNILNIERKMKDTAKKESSLKSWREQLSLLQSQKKEKEERLSLNQKRLDNMKEQESKLADVKEYDFGAKKKRLDELKNALEKENKKESLSEKLSSKQNELKKDKEEIFRLEKAIADLKFQLKEIKQDEKGIREKQDGLKKKKEELKRYKEEADSVKEKITEMNSFLSFNKENISELEDEIDKKSKAQKKVEEFQWYESFFSDTLPTIAQSIETSLFSRILSQFVEVFEEWFNQLLESENIFCTIDEDFSPVIRINDYDTDATNLSGGEKTCLALAYRLALNKVINDVVSNINTKDFIILDEPTEGFSTEQLDRVRDVINSLDMRQIIIVSHETKVESFVDKIIRISKSESVSRIFSD